MTDYRKAYGLPERYFLSLGRMVEKKNLSTLVEAYARFARASVEKHGAWSMEHGDGESAARYSVPALVFVGSGELEGALREQARSLGLRVVDRTGVGPRDQRAKGQPKAGDQKSEVSGTDDCKLTTENSAESDRGAVASRKAETLKDGKAEATDGEASGSASATAHRYAAATETHDSLPATRDQENCGTVFFYGFRQIEENPIFYALAEAFILPSLKEEWGLVVNEAMAAGLPVIVSRTAGCAEDLVPARGQVTRIGVCGDGSPRRPTGWLVTSEEEADDEDVPATKEADARVARPYLEQRSNGFVFDPRSSDALCEALRRIAVAGEKLKVKGEKQGAWPPARRAYGSERSGEQGVRETADGEDAAATLRAKMGRRSREIVAKFSCEKFARQALRAADAAQQV